MTTLAAIRAFAESFARSPLYETGWSDPWNLGGASKAETDVEMRIALAYVVGASDATRLACPYMGRSWRIAHLVGIAARRLSLAVEDSDLPSAFSGPEVERIVASYRTEFVALLNDETLAA